jgi:hypothetical protein
MEDKIKEDFKNTECSYVIWTQSVCFNGCFFNDY